MRDAALLLAALVASAAGLGWLALAMDTHWAQVRGSDPLAPPMRRLLRVLGLLGVVVALVLCLRVDHASMAVLVWVMTLALGAFSVAFLLSWRARWLRVLVMWVGRSA